MRHKISKQVFPLLAGLLVGVSGHSQAANWLMLQGTEAESAAPRAYVWGFVQGQYQKDNSTPNAGGGYIPPKLIGPNLSSQEQFNVNRARLGVRGTGFPLDGKVNYFLLAEFGNNGITAPGGGGARLTDASITMNQIEGARIRAGLFKTPGSEEALQAIHVFDYINFTTVTNQMILERLPNRRDSEDIPPVTLPAPGPFGAFDQPVAAFRDVGVQLFDSFEKDDWEHSYALMIGNGNGLNFGDIDSNKDTYLYWSSEKIFAGAGPRREGMKLFAWSQSGKRYLDSAANDAAYTPVVHDRDRSGFGVKYLKKPFRVSAEYMKGEGMIFVGPDKASFDLNTAAAPGNGEDGKASGFYLDAGYYIPDSKWEIDARYDVYDRLKDDVMEMQFKTLTLGAQYHVNRKTRINMEIADRSAEAINFGTGAGPNANLDGVDTRYAVQITHIF